MRIDDNKLIRYINNDLPTSEKDLIKLLIEKNQKIKSKYLDLKKFKLVLKKESDLNKKIKMPKSLYKKILKEKNINNNYFLNIPNNFSRIAAGILIFFSLGLILTFPNKTFLSQNPLVKIKKNNQVHIFYEQKTLNEFLSKNNNCSKPEEFIDENNKNVFAVSCEKD